MFSGFAIKEDKIRGGYLTPAFSGAHEWVEVLRNSSVLGGSHQIEQNQKWLPHACLLEGQ